MIPISEVYNVDCIEYMKTIQDKFFDLAIVDPPYGIGISKFKKFGKRRKGNTLTNYKSSEWDSEIPDIDYFDELFRVSKEQIIFGANYFLGIIDFSGWSWIVWDKGQPEDISFAMGELAVYSGKKSLQIYRGSRKLGNCISNNDVLAKLNAKIHQCQKPIALYSWLLKKYAKKGDFIFDSHLGSGSSRIAAYKMGFNFIGCEIDKDYFEDSEVRFRKECLGEVKMSNGSLVTSKNLFEYNETNNKQGI